MSTWSHLFLWRDQSGGFKLVRSYQGSEAFHRMGPRFHSIQGGGSGPRQLFQKNLLILSTSESGEPSGDLSKILSVQTHRSFFSRHLLSPQDVPLNRTLLFDENGSDFVNRTGPGSYIVRLNKEGGECGSDESKDESVQ